MQDETTGCKLLQGEYNGISREELQKTKSAKLCSSIVTQLRPGANAMTWESRTQRCWAEFEAPSLRSEQCLSCITCLFGNYIYGVINKVDVTSSRDGLEIWLDFKFALFLDPYQRQINSYSTPRKRLNNSTTLSSAKQECDQSPECTMFYNDCGYNTYYYCYGDSRPIPSGCGSILHYKRGNITFAYIPTIYPYK